MRRRYVLTAESTSAHALLLRYFYRLYFELVCDCLSSFRNLLARVVDYFNIPSADCVNSVAKSVIVVHMNIVYTGDFPDSIAMRFYNVTDSNLRRLRRIQVLVRN